MLKLNRYLCVTAVLMANLAICPVVSASQPATDIPGTIEAVNYGKQTITVNGHEYKVTRHVRLEGINGFMALHPGMKVDITVLGPPTAPTSDVMRITPAPPHS